MLKNSFLIVLIQATGIIFAMLSVYFVAGDMGPEVYSLRGIQGIVAGIMLAFSQLGVETTMMREALYWMEQGNHEKVKEYATQSILSRLIGFVVLVPILAFYLGYLSFSKYDGGYLWLFGLYLIGSCISSLNNSMALIVRSQGGYVFSQLVTTLNSDIFSGLAILVYLKWGADVYLVFFALSSVPVLFIFLLRLKQIFSFKYFRIRPTLKKIKESKYLWMRTYLDYFKTNADSLLVSLLFSPAIMGIYAVYKLLENMARSFVEGFFDVLAQRVVKFKGQCEQLIKEERKFNIVRWAVIGLVVIAGVVFSINPNFYIQLVNLTQYDYMELIVYTVLTGCVIWLIGKYEGMMIALFATSKANFKLGIIIFWLTIISYFWLFFIHTIEGALLQRVTIWVLTTAISIVLFRKNRMQYYTHIYK